MEGNGLYAAHESIIKVSLSANTWKSVPDLQHPTPYRVLLAQHLVFIFVSVYMNIFNCVCVYLCMFKHSVEHRVISMCKQHFTSVLTLASPLCT